MKKFGLFAVSALLVSSLVFANNVSENVSEEITSVENVYEAETFTDSIEVNGVVVDLYKEFVEPEKELEYVKETYSEVLDLIAQEKGIEELSVENWEQYQVAATEMIFEELPEDIWKAADALVGFFDIYENTDQNVEIRDLYEASIDPRAPMEIDDEDVLAEIDLLTPYTSQKLVETDDREAKQTIGINLTNAVTYAENNASGYNTPTYDKFSNGDCTNFVSQILEAGGVKQEVYSSENKGWWHKATSHWYGTSHSHSVSWIRADTFAKYMGVSYTTTSNVSFANKLTKGDIVGFDKGSDGDWNHMAFVTDKKSTKTTYNGSTFYNYKIAQHTSNYCGWAQGGAAKGWTTLGSNGYTYGIIRR